MLYQLFFFVRSSHFFLPGLSSRAHEIHYMLRLRLGLGSWVYLLLHTPFFLWHHSCHGGG